MARCANCGKEFEAKRSTAKFCSGTCKKQTQRSCPAKKEEVVPLRIATLQDYIDHPEDYAPRDHPEELNWGIPLNADELKELEKIRKTRIHNRVTIPGDWDYVR